MKNLKFRLATLEDRHELLEFDRVSTEADIIEGKRFPVLDKEWVLEYYICKNWFIVAEINWKIVAYILTQIIEWMNWVDKMVWIEHVWVLPDYRRMWIALEIEEYTKKYYKWKASYLTANIHPLNKRSIELNKKLGAELSEKIIKIIKI